MKRWNCRAICSECGKRLFRVFALPDSRRPLVEAYIAKLICCPDAPVNTTWSEYELGKLHA